jgi:hypothetical protein
MYSQMNLDTKFLADACLASSHDRIIPILTNMEFWDEEIINEVTLHLVKKADEYKTSKIER